MPITIETTVHIDEDRRLILQLPADIAVGTHRVVAILDEKAEGAAATGKELEWSFPVLANAQWPPDMPLTREEMYGDDAR